MNPKIKTETHLRYKQKIICIVILAMIIILPSVQAQKKIKVRASGSYTSRDLTPQEARQKAIEEAQRNALVKAGISESIQVSDFLYTFEDNEQFREIFQGFTSTETGGEIILDSVINESFEFDMYNNMITNVEIEATVFKHKEKKDLSLQIKVEGINEFYNSGDLMVFTFTPTSHGYLKIFNVIPDDASLLYPYSDADEDDLNDDPNKLFEKHITHTFPLYEADPPGYRLETDDPEGESEFNLLIFVFTRKNISFMEKTTVKKIMKWIYCIPPDERVVKQYGFIIRGEE